MMRIIFVVALAISAMARPCFAQGDQITVRAWIGDEQDKTQTYSVNQQVMLYVDVATTRWFTDGTQLSHVEVPNLIAKQRSTLATNYTERKDGQTWSHQRWEINLYPQVSGEYQIPPVAVTVEVSLSNGKKAQKTLYTQPLGFRASLPSGELTNQGAGDSHWIAAPDVSAEQTWTTSNDSLHVGDSITRTMTIKAQDSLSILIPNILLSDQHQSDYQVYATPPQLSDSQNRGTYLSTRVESVTYVLQRGGNVSFPPLTVTWWNTKQQKLERITLAGQKLSVKHTLKSWLGVYGPWLLVVTLVVILLIVGGLMVKRYYRKRPLPKVVQFHQALKAQQWGKARSMLYQKLRRLTGLTAFRSYQNGTLSLPQDGQPDVFWARWKAIKAQKLNVSHWRQPLKLEQKLGLTSTKAFSKPKSKHGT